MIFPPVKPENARAWYGARFAINVALIALICVPVLFILDAVGFLCIGVVPLIAVAYFLFFHVLENRGIDMQCPHCNRVIGGKTAWRCGNCGEVNNDTIQYPLVDRCGQTDCGVEAKAYRCHHKGCGQLMFLSADRQEENYATYAGKPLADESLELKRKREEELQEKRHAISVENLEAKLEALKAERDLRKPKDPQARIKAKIDTKATEYMYQGDYIEELRAKVKEDYKDDPKRRKRWLEFLDGLESDLL